MAIQYSGNAQTSTFMPATKQALINAVETALLAAGWSTVSGHATTNLLMQSATTPQGYAIRVRLKDNAGTCVTFSLESTDGVLIGGNSTTVGGAYLNPSVGFTFQCICNKYQAFIFVIPGPNQSRGFAAFGVPWVPPFLVPVTSRIGWLAGNCANDADSTPRVCFRNVLAQTNGTAVGCIQVMYNAAFWSYNTTGNVNGYIGLAYYGAFNCNSTGGVCWRWQNNAAMLYDAIIGWGTASAGEECKFKGQLWDACISTQPYTADVAANFDGHNWQTITDSYFVNFGIGTLVLATS